MLPSESENYIEDLFQGYHSRVYRLKLCSEEMLHQRSGAAFVSAIASKKRYRDTDIVPVNLLNIAVKLDTKVKETQSILGGLDEEEQKFVQSRYFKKMTMDQVGAELNLSRRELYNVRDRVFKKAASILVIASTEFEVPKDVRDCLSN